MSEKLTFPWTALPAAIFSIGFVICAREVFVLGELGSDEVYAFRALLALGVVIMSFLVMPDMRTIAITLGSAFIASVAAAGASPDGSTAVAFGNVAVSYTALATVWIVLGSMVVRRNRVFGAGYAFLVLTSAGAFAATFLMTTWSIPSVRLALGISMIAVSIAAGVFFWRRGTRTQAEAI